MNEGNGKVKKAERRFSKEQYQMLKRCSEKKNMTEWNEWRERNPDEEILLEGRHFRGAHLEGANLFHAKLNSACFYEADLKGADLRLADLEDADLFGANLEDAKLAHANLKVRSISKGNLQSAEVWSADLENACLSACDLKKANFSYAVLKGACFNDSKLAGASFQQAVVDGSTSFWECEVDKHSGRVKGTDFRGVGLGVCKIDPGTRQLLEYNIRRMNWEDWYKGHWFWRWPVRWFWALSDYGRSTGWIIAWFFILALIFALIYFVWGLAEPPGIVSNLFELEGTTEGVYTYTLVDMTRIERQPAEPIKVSKGTALVRAIYFSVVTMTTLGFGDLYANPLRIPGHILLALQVILGYVLLGALITRFAVLFTAGGPAGKFSRENGEGRIENGEVRMEK